MKDINIIAILLNVCIVCLELVLQEKTLVMVMKNKPNSMLHVHERLSIDIEFIWIQAAMRLLVITVNCFSAYRTRMAVQNALHTI